MMGFSALVLVGVMTVRVWTLDSTDDDYDALFAALKKDMISVEYPIKFDHVGVNTRGSYDKTAGKFYAHKNGHYWVSLSAGAMPSSGYSVHFRLYQEGADVCSIRRDSYSHNGNDTITRDIVVTMKRLQTLYVNNGQKLFSDGGHQTSFSAFLLSGLMNNSIYFSAVRHLPITLTTGQTLPYTRVLLNEGNAFNKDKGEFKAPKDGLYFFSFSIGTTFLGDKMYDLSLRRRTSILGSLERLSTTANDYDSLGRSGLYHLFKGDVVHVQSDKRNELRSSSSDRQTSFSGFIYEPSHGFNKAWSVSRTVGWSGQTELSPIPFDKVFVDSEGDWNKENFYLCAVTGTYYVTVTVAAIASKTAHVTVMVDNNAVASVISTSTNRNGPDTFSRSAILHLRKGCKVYLKAEKQTAFHSSRKYQTSFGGFLLFPTT